MCGFCVTIDRNDQPVAAERIAALTDAISHRGPDDHGYHFGPNFAFGHRRLSILDVSPLGHQPMSLGDRLCIAYNGEIYNYVELREELMVEGYEFQTGTDTEVILAAYDYWGVDCLNQFNGMWAFVIHDAATNTLFFSRDRFGIKPLYYREQADTVTFGSEIKQLLDPAGSNPVNEDVLLEYMLTRIDDHTENTYFHGIKSLLPAHYMVYDLADHSFQIERYYTLKVDPAIRELPEVEAFRQFADVLDNAIELHLRSDVRIGACVSGGLDSSAVSAIAADKLRHENGPALLAINAKSSDRETDESHYAESLGKSSGLDMHLVSPTFDDFVGTIDDVIFTQEMPFGSPSLVMSWHVFEKAHELGCKVMLNGQGGDEVLLGYERYFASTLRARNPLRLAAQIFRQYRNSRLSLRQTLLYALYFRVPRIRLERKRRNPYVKPGFKRERYFEDLQRSARSFQNPETLQILEISSVQLPHLLRYEDRNSMRHSVETRLPLLDHRLVEFGISLPLSAKIRDGWTKYVLRRAIEGRVPHEIVWRKDKFGFESPSSWIARYTNEMLEEVKRSRLLAHFCHLDRIVRDYPGMSDWDRWLFFNIARWERVFRVTVEPASARRCATFRS